MLSVAPRRRRRDNPQVNQTVADNTALGRVGPSTAVGLVFVAPLSDDFEGSDAP